MKKQTNKKPHGMKGKINNPFGAPVKYPTKEIHRRVDERIHPQVTERLDEVIKEEKAKLPPS